MPKGVEHFVAAIGNHVVASVPFTLMPKGVEHKPADESKAFRTIVPFTLMPKGVEHRCELKTVADAEGSIYVDAERR